MKSIEVFISFHRKDEELCKELQNHLVPLQRREIITSWQSHEIIAGQETKGEIDKHLNRAELILLLVSSDFIASDELWTGQVKQALKQNESGKAHVIPVLLRAANWKNPPIDGLSALPSNGIPIKKWTDKDEAFVDVVQGIEEAVR